MSCLVGAGGVVRSGDLCVGFGWVSAGIAAGFVSWPSWLTVSCGMVLEACCFVCFRRCHWYVVIPWGDWWHWNWCWRHLHSGSVLLCWSLMLCCLDLLSCIFTAALYFIHFKTIWTHVLLNVGNVASGEGIGVGDVFLHLLNLVGLLDLSCMSLLDAALGPAMVMVSMWCGVELLCLLVHLWCDVLLVGDLLEDLLEDLLLCLLLLGLLVSYLWLFVYLDLHNCEKCPRLLQW